MLTKQTAGMLWAGRILTALPALLLTFSGVMKLMQPPEVVEGFVKFGYQQSALTPIGIVELLCTAIYLIPKTSILGAILLTGYLGGAVATHVRVSDAWFGPFGVGVLVWAGLFLREQRVRDLIPFQS